MSAADTTTGATGATDATDATGATAPARRAAGATDVQRNWVRMVSSAGPGGFRSLRLVRSELGMVFRRRRNQVALAVLVAMPVIIAIAVRVSSDGGPADVPVQEKADCSSSPTTNRLRCPSVSRRTTGSMVRMASS